jgi:hypothetical protein
VSSETDLLTSLLDGLEAALYGYGVLGARLDAPTRTAAQAAADTHRATRDRVDALLQERKVDPPAPPAAYDVQVAGQADALALAVRLESGLAVRYRDLVGGTDDPRLRRLGVDGLTGTAVRATSWRRLLGQAPGTEALPGSA